MADPTKPTAGNLSQQELDERFPDQPVRYVVESRYHWDHAGGTRMFADTAEFIAHENIAWFLVGALTEAPPPSDTKDTNGDNRLYREEALTGTRANFDRFDTNWSNAANAKDSPASLLFFVAEFFWLLVRRTVVETTESLREANRLR